MILINLLPHREATRQHLKQQMVRQLALSALLGVLLCGLVFGHYQRELDRLQARKHLLQQAIAGLEADMGHMAGLQKEMAALRVRQAVLLGLQTDRNLPVHLLEELVMQLPDGTVLSRLQQHQQDIVLVGQAVSQQRVTELLHNLSSSEWLRRVELVEFVAPVANGPNQSGPNQTGPKQDPPQPGRFTIRFGLSRGQGLP